MGNLHLSQFQMMNSFSVFLLVLAREYSQKNTNSEHFISRNYSYLEREKPYKHEYR